MRAEHAALHGDHLQRGRWLPRSVAAVQSDSSRHSKPRSLASRMVVCTQTSVVMPVSIRLSMPRVRRMQFEVGGVERPLPGLSMIDLAGQRRQFGDDLPARLAAHQDAAARPGVADADAAGADLPRAPALVGRQVREVGAMALAGVDDVEAGWPQRRQQLARSARSARG